MSLFLGIPAWVYVVLGFILGFFALSLVFIVGFHLLVEFLKTPLGKTIGMSVALVGSILVGWWMTDLSLDQLHRVQIIDRVPVVKAQSVIPGEVKLLGTARRGKEPPVTSPRENQPSIYYRYKKERREGTGDDRHWETLVDRTEWIDFNLQDESGTIPITPEEGVFRARETYQKRVGDLRHTVWRIEPGDELFVFGYVPPREPSLSVRFNVTGEYVPVISAFGEEGQRIYHLWWSLLYGLFALLGLGGFSVVVVYLFRFHQTWVFLFTLTAVMSGSLFYYGIWMMNGDLHSTVERTQLHQERARKTVSHMLKRDDINWNGQWESLGGLDEPPFSDLERETRERIRGIRFGLAQAIQRANQYLGRFPESLLAWFHGYSRFESVWLPKQNQKLLQQMEARRADTSLADEWTAWLGLIGSLAAGLAGLWYGMTSIQTKRYIENVPTTPISGITYGLNEVKGTASVGDQAEPLYGPLTEKPCVYYHYKVQEKQPSDDGTNWQTIENEQQSIPFLCREEQAEISVSPSEADVVIDPDRRERRKEGDRRYTEERIEVGDETYLLGSASVDFDTPEGLEITGKGDQFPYVLSNQSETELKFYYAQKGFWFLGMGTALAIFCSLVVLGLAGLVSPWTYLLSMAFNLGLVLVLFCILLYNDLVFLNQRVEQCWSNIDVSLKKRADLIPRLEKVIERYMEHEEDVLEQMAELRSKYEGGVVYNPTEADDLLDAEMSFLDELQGLEEEYPGLKSDNMAQELFDRLVELEDEISLMRDGYNKAVEQYNQTREKLPEALIARAGQFKPAEYLTTSR